MEIYSSTTRFAFACNQSNKIIEPLQSRCAILRFARLTDGQVVRRIMQICEAEKVEHSDDGIAALVFSAEGDMRQAINNLQSTVAGSGFVSGDNVFKVVDSPHPIKVQAMIKACHDSKVDEALDTLKELWYGRLIPSMVVSQAAWMKDVLILGRFFFFLPRGRDLGYSSNDIVSTMFRVTKTIDSLSEHSKLEFIKVRRSNLIHPEDFIRIVTSRKLVSPTCASSKAFKLSYNCPAASLGFVKSTCIQICSFHLFDLPDRNTRPIYSSPIPWSNLIPPPPPFFFSLFEIKRFRQIEHCRHDQDVKSASEDDFIEHYLVEDPVFDLLYSSICSSFAFNRVNSFIDG